MSFPQETARRPFCKVTAEIPFLRRILATVELRHTCRERSHQHILFRISISYFQNVFNLFFSHILFPIFIFHFTINFLFFFHSMHGQGKVRTIIRCRVLCFSHALQAFYFLSTQLLLKAKPLNQTHSLTFQSLKSSFSFLIQRSTFIRASGLLGRGARATGLSELPRHYTTLP